MPIFFLLIGILGIYLFHEGIYLSIPLSAAVFALAAGYVLWLYRRSRIGPLAILLFVVYALPFIHIIPYLWFDFDAEAPALMWGLVANPYMTNKTVVELMSMIGAVGVAGFATGISLFQKRLSPVPAGRRPGCHGAPSGVLSLPFFCAWVAIAIALTWLNAPVDTIFTAAYTQSTSLIDTWNFSSSWMISYAFLLFTLADSLFEPSAGIASLKRRIVLMAFLAIVIWFQLLRGDRESLPCVISALLMYYVWGKGRLDSAEMAAKCKSPVLLVALFSIAVVSYLFGALRIMAVGVGSMADLFKTFGELAETGSISFDNFLTGTWSGILLTPLSVAGDYLNNSLPLKYGQTYLDLLRSTIPGFLADWIGYSRPIDSLHGPAWEMAYGGGGIHAVVVPFIDFRMAGVFTIVALWSFAFVQIERIALKGLTVIRLAFLGIIGMAVPHWLWYGEKNIINAFIIWFIVSVFYQFRWPRPVVNSADGAGRDRSVSQSWVLEGSAERREGAT